MSAAFWFCGYSLYRTQGLGPLAARTEGRNVSAFVASGYPSVEDSPAFPFASHPRDISHSRYRVAYLVDLLIGPVSYLLR
jgi:hypothetical protein